MTMPAGGRAGALRPGRRGRHLRGGAGRPPRRRGLGGHARRPLRARRPALGVGRRDAPAALLARRRRASTRASARRARASSGWSSARAGRSRGVVWLARREDGWEADSERVLRARASRSSGSSPATADAPLPEPAPSETSRSCLHEPEAGVLRAGDGVRALVERARERRRCGWSAARHSPTATAALRRRHARSRPTTVVWACGGLARGAVPRPGRAARDAPVRSSLFDAGPEWAGAGLGRLRRERSYGHGAIEPYGMKVASDREGDAGRARPAAAERGADDARGRRRATSPSASRRSRARRCARRPPATTR